MAEKIAAELAKLPEVTKTEIAGPGFIAEEDWFHIAPGRAVHVRLREDAHAPDLHRSGVPVGEIRAINALRPITIRGTR